MKLLNLFLLLLCVVEIYAQRSRTTNNNQDVSTQEPRSRGRGRSRFSVTEELLPSSERPSTNRRQPSRTRTSTSIPVAPNRRGRPTEASRGYAVEEINNDSPIDSFRRQSKPRILTESRFDIPTATVPRRQQTYERASSVLYASTEPPIEDLGFGSTARAILQARGEPLPQRTTTPVIDEAYLLNNFGTTFRSLAASINDVPIQRATPLRSEVPIQRATPLRSEVPILDKNDFPSRRSSIRGDPLPSLRGSDVILERQPASRGRKTNQARVLTEQSRPSTRTESQRANIQEDNDSMLEDELTRIEADAENPESVQGIFEQSDIVTEAQPLESSSESLVVDNEDLRKTSSFELSTQKSTEPQSPKVTESNNRRYSARRRVEIETESTSAPRTRSSRTRVSSRPEAASADSATRVRSSRRKYEDAEVAESRSRGPSVFTAEQYQEVTSRSRTGRRIDSRIESVPQRITIDLTPITTTIKSRSSGRRATTTASSVRDRNVSRERSRSRAKTEEVTVSVSRSPSKQKSSFTKDAAFYGDKTSVISNLEQQPTGRRETSHRFNTAEPKPSISEGSGQVFSSRRSLVRKPSASKDKVAENKREPVRRVESTEATRRSSPVENRRETTSRKELQEPRNTVSSRNLNHRQNNIQDETIFFGDKSVRTQTNIPPTTTTAEEEESTTYLNFRSRSRFSNLPPKIDESKLEVLPLFERETKSGPSSNSRGHRSRSSVNRKQNIVHDHMHVSATENDVKFVEKPTTNAFTKVTVTRTQSVEASTSRARLSTRVNSSTQSTSTEATTRRPTLTTTTTKIPETSATTKKWATRSPPVIKESVVAEVNEVTSKSTFTRRQKVSKAKAAEMLSRGNKKATIKVTDTGKKTSSEEIDEEDNYPEPFKALIQAKKKQKIDPRPLQSSATGASIKSTSTEKVFVISAASPRGSSAVRVVTTDSPSSRRRPQIENEIVNDNENELDPKPVVSTTPSSVTRSERLRQTNKISEKTKYTSKPREKQFKSSTERTKFSSEKVPTKTTPASRKTYSTRKPTEHHFRRKALRSTALPPSTTPLNLINREAKFSAKFIKKESKNTALDNLEQLKSDEGPQPKSMYSNKKGTERSSREDVERAVKKLNGAITQTPKPSLPIKKFNSSRYSSRYRSDISQRSSIFKTSTSAPFYTPTIPTPAYIPTVPTITPPVTQVGEYIAEEDSDLGLEVISFDEPVNTIPSANLVNGEFLTTDKNTRHSFMVKDGTTEKAVSIIERIINSITSISTTAASNITSSTDSPPKTSNEDTGNSAILKLAPKKLTNKDKTVLDDKTNIIETITSEKPTTIIEKIRSSLSAIQSNEVGTSDFNTLSSSSTTPLSTVTKYSAKFRGSSVGTTALPAPMPLSTSINPLSVFDEIDKNQVLEKRTIGKLLNILHGLVSTDSPTGSEKLVVVTPKTGFIATTSSSQEPLEAIDFNTIEPRADFANFVSSSTEIPQSSSLVYTENTATNSIVNKKTSFVNTESATSTVNNESSSARTETVFSENLVTSSTENLIISSVASTQADSQTTTQISEQTTLPTVSPAISFNTSSSSESTANILSLDQTTTLLGTTLDYTTTVSSETTISDTVIPTSQTQTTVNMDKSVDSSKHMLPPTFPIIPNIEVSPGSVSIFSANDLSNYITPDDNLFNTVTIASRVGFDNTVLTTTSTTEGATSTTLDSVTSTESSTIGMTTEVTETTTAYTADTTDTISTSTVTDVADTTTVLSTTVPENITMLTNIISLNTSNFNSSANTPLVFNRSGKILSSDLAEPFGNSIEVSTSSTTTSTTPDYFIFAVLNNNTILRKKPPTIPNKDTPFVIVGLYPNNTVIRKFPNGTLVPMEQIIKVDSNRMARLLANEQTSGTFSPKAVVSSTTTSSTPQSTSVVSSTTSTTTDGQSTMSTETSTFSTTLGSTLIPSTTTFSTTIIPTTTSFIPTTTEGTTARTTNVVHIMSVPGTTRISKAQTTTAKPGITSTSTIQSSTDTIPPTLGEILNGKTVDALNNLLTNAEVPSTKAPNFKTLQVNQNSISSTTTSQSTPTEVVTENDAPFTSPTIGLQSTTQFPSSSDRLISSTLISTPMPTSTTTENPTTRKIIITSTTPTTKKTTTNEIKTTTARLTTTLPQVKTTAGSRVTTGFPTLFPTILTTLFPNLLGAVETTPGQRLSSTRKPPTDAEIFNTIGDRFEVLSAAGSTARPTTVLPLSSTSQKISTTTPLSTTTRRSTTQTTTTTQGTTTTKTAQTSTSAPNKREDTEALFEELKKSGKLKDLNEEQRKNLEEIEKIEKQQAELLKQLSLLGILPKVPFPSSTTRKTTSTTTIHSIPTTTESVVTTIRFNESILSKSNSGGEIEALFDQFKKEESQKIITEAQKAQLNELEKVEKQRSELFKQLNFLKMLGTLQFPNTPLIPTNLETTSPIATTTPTIIITTPTESTTIVDIATLASKIQIKEESDNLLEKFKKSKTSTTTIHSIPTTTESVVTTIKFIESVVPKSNLEGEIEALFDQFKNDESQKIITEAQRAQLNEMETVEKQRSELFKQLHFLKLLGTLQFPNTSLIPPNLETTIPIATTTPKIVITTPTESTTIIDIATVASKIQIKEESEELFEKLKKSKSFLNIFEEQRAKLAKLDKIEKQQEKLLMQLSLVATLVEMAKSQNLPTQKNTTIPQITTPFITTLKPNVTESVITTLGVETQSPTTLPIISTPFTTIPIVKTSKSKFIESTSTPLLTTIRGKEYQYPDTTTRKNDEETRVDNKSRILSKEQQAQLDKIDKIEKQQNRLLMQLNLLNSLVISQSSTILPITTIPQTTTPFTTSTLKPSTAVPTNIGVRASKSVTPKVKTREDTEELFKALKRDHNLKLNEEQQAKLDKLNIIEKQQMQLFDQLNLLKILGMTPSSTILPITPPLTFQTTTPIITKTPKSINSIEQAFFPDRLSKLDRSKTRDETVELFNQLKEGKMLKKEQQASLDKINYFEKQQVELLEQLNSLKILTRSARVLQQSSTTLPTTTSQTTNQPPTSTTNIKLTTTSKPASTTIGLKKLGTPTPKTPEETEVLFEQLKKSGKLKNLSEEQRKSLEEIEKIEKEQAELLRTLTLLTTMFGGAGGRAANLPSLPNLNSAMGGNSNSLANRIIAMAMERDKSRSTPTTLSPTTKKPTTKSTTKRPNSIQDQLPVSKVEGSTERTTPSLEDILRQYNLSGLSTPAPLTSTYGKTDEALLAAILKEQGIGPTTPKVLGDKVKEAGLFEENPAAKAPKPKPKPKPRTTTTARPIGGRLMQGLNWLLDILDPPTTKRPAPKRPKAKPQPTQQTGGDDELLTNQPTRITPVVTAAPVTKPNLSQDEIQVLIKQLEAAQQDPNAIDHLDFSKIKNLQNLLNVNEGVQVTSAGQNGATLRATPRPQKIRSTTEKDQFLQQVNRKPKASTVPTLSVSNSIDEDVELVQTTTKTRVLPPVSLNPIPGIDNQGDSLIRSNLLTAAVNVTRAISSFLGSAFQGASRGFRSLLGSGTSMVGNIAQTSSAGTG